ncbi:unnamed protein product, partial [Laminaria digitata]
EQVQEHGVLASSLLLLADSHAARAEKGALRLRKDARGRASSKDLTPAEAYRSTVSGANTAVAAATGRGVGGAGGGVGRGSAQPVGGGDRYSRPNAIVPDMDDSIMRGPGVRKVVPAGGVEGGGGGEDTAAAELAKKFRPQRDDLLELERQLAKLGLESKTGGPGGRARHRQGLGNPGAHLSSALGESFCLLNQSVIFGGGLAAGGGTGNGNGNGNGIGNGNRNGNGNGRPEAAAGGDGGDGEREKRGEGGSRERPEGSSRPGAITPLEGGEVKRGDPGDGRRAVGRGQVESAAPGGGEGVGDRSGGGGGTVRPGVEGGSVAGAGIRAGEEEEEESRRLSESGEERRAQEEEKEQGEIMRLLTCLKTLGDENVSLMKECEDRDK